VSSLRLEEKDACYDGHVCSVDGVEQDSLVSDFRDFVMCRTLISD
jgi:hypothetical protein